MSTCIVEPHPTDTPEKQPSTILQTFRWFECICICLYTMKTPEMRQFPYPVKRTGSAIPAVPELYQIHRMLIYCFCTIVLHLHWIHVSIIAHRANLSQYCTAMEMSENMVSLCSTKPCYTFPHLMEVCTLEATTIRISPYYRHTAEVRTVSTLEGFHCQR